MRVGLRLLSIVFLILVMFRAAQAQEAFTYDDHGRRDPLWQLVTPAGAMLNYETEFLITDLALEGIMAGADGGNVAIINGRILRDKDIIGEFIIERVGERSVVLSKGRQKFELKLKKEE